MSMDRGSGDVRRLGLWTPIAIVLGGCATSMGQPGSIDAGAGRLAGGAVRTDAPTTGAAAATTLADLDESTLVYMQHIATLSNSFFEGRAPGYRGNDLAADYVAWHFERLGLEPAFPEVGRLGDPEFAEAGEDGRAFQQTLSVNGATEIISANAGYAVSGREVRLELGEDYNPVAVSSDGVVRGPVAFVGYSIESGPEGYASYREGDDLTGKIALLLRFEPMDGSGASLWDDGGSWTRRASLIPKIAAAVDRGAAGVILVAPPGADDPRTNRLETVRTSRWGASVGVPMIMMSQKAAKRMVERLDPEGRSLLDLRRLADRGEAGVIDLDRGGATLSIDVDLDISQLPTTNVGGVLRGAGALAKQWVIVGGHYDHVGYGYFGSRSPNLAGTIHPGADDNASGTAGVILAAQLLGERYARDGAADRRSVLFLAFTAEEMGLLGAKHFVQHSTLGAEDVTAMINMDMIGRLEGDDLDVYGVGTSPSWATMVPEAFAAFDVNTIEAGAGPSDHTWFYREGIPVLHIFTGLHNDYHRPGDVWPLINFTGAVAVVNGVVDLVEALAHEPLQLAFEETQGSSRSGSPRMANVKVRLGIAPGSYGEDAPGVSIGGVSPGTSAAEAGIKAGDIITHWDGEEIGGMRGLMERLGVHEPGDVVTITVDRDGDRLELKTTLKARDASQ